ncbi:class I SAM-dependent methyltransferase [Enterococcus sp. BWT-B8]|uniref:class I SAM-dependent methyltransferase n=1 Tax=Enterococcus sp. BWT-B8 TaxID=2885157 RepID=UPI001E3F13D5|nr:class I SAM-dependent methyltransferase [Enterococcus sp. BWT-B8]
MLEFESDIGNLIEKPITAGKTVYLVEPSPEMRKIAKGKTSLQNPTFYAGGMENFPELPAVVDVIVSNRVFHQLRAAEKKRVVENCGQLLSEGGKIIFGDTMFLSQATYAKIVTEKKLWENSILQQIWSGCIIRSWSTWRKVLPRTVFRPSTAK